MDQTLTPYASSYGQSTAEAALQPLLEAFGRRERTEQELTLSLTSICAKEPQATWQALSLLDQYHRRGSLETTLFRDLKRDLNSIAFGNGGAHLSADGQTYARPRRASHAQTAAQQPEFNGTAQRGDTEFVTSSHTQTHDTGMRTSSMRTSSLRTSAHSSGAENTSALRTSAHPAQNSAQTSTHTSTRPVNQTSTLQARGDERGADSTQARATPPEPAEAPDVLIADANHDPGLYAASDTSLDAYLDAHPDPLRDANLNADWTHSDSITPKYAKDTTSSQYEWVDSTESSPNLTLPRSLEAQPVRVESAQLVRSSVQRAGTLLDDRFVLVEPLASGSISIVFKALDNQRGALPEAERYVAIKCPQEYLRHDPRAVAAFHFEYAQSQTISHPNIAKVYDFNGTPGGCYIVMEILQGESLGRMIERIAPRRLPMSRALTIIREIGLALAHAHDHGVVHGNLQSNSVTLLPNGELRVSDFAQSAGWLAPDAPRAEPSDDLYSLACIAHELLCGCTPEAGLNISAVSTASRPLYARHLNTQQWRALRSGLSDHRQQRAGNVRRWLSELDLSNADVRLPELRVLEAEVAGRSGVPRAVWWVGAAAGVALIAAISLVVWQRLQPPPAPETQYTAIVTPDEPQQDLQSGDPARLAELQAEQTSTPPTSDNIRIDSLNPMPGTAGGVLLPTVTFTDDSYEVSERNEAVRLVVRRSTPLEKPLQLRWFTIAGSAQPGVDYVGFQYASVRMEAGERSAEILIPLIKVANRDRAVSFDVRISATTEALPGRTVVTKVVILPTR